MVGCQGFYRPCAFTGGTLPCHGRARSSRRGALTLTLATGAGAASQRALGTGVIGGMLSATLLGVVLVPIFFVWVLTVLRRKPK